MNKEKFFGAINVKSCDEIQFFTAKILENSIYETIDKIIQIIISNRTIDELQSTPVIFDKQMYDLFIEAIDTDHSSLIKIYGRDEKLKNLFKEKLDEYIKTNNLQDYYIVKVES